MNKLSSFLAQTIISDKILEPRFCVKFSTSLKEKLYFFCASHSHDSDYIDIHEFRSGKTIVKIKDIRDIEEIPESDLLQYLQLHIEKLGVNKVIDVLSKQPVINKV